MACPLMGVHRVGKVRADVLYKVLLLSLLVPATSLGSPCPKWVAPQSRPAEDPRAMWRLQQVLLDLAEEKFGTRDISKKIYQPTFHVDGPHIRLTPTLDGAFAELSHFAQNYWPTAVYELAHETVHLLNPQPGQQSTVLEEGLAVEFAVFAQLALGLSPQLPEEGPYRDALKAIRRLPDAPFSIGFQIRMQRGSLRHARGPDLVGVDPALAAQLLKKFHNDRTVID